MKTLISILFCFLLLQARAQNKSFNVPSNDFFGVTIEFYSADTLTSSDHHKIQVHFTTDDEFKTLFKTELDEHRKKSFSTFTIEKVQEEDDENAKALCFYIRSSEGEPISLYFFRDIDSPTVGYVYPNRDYYITISGAITY